MRSFLWSIIGTQYAASIMGWTVLNQWGVGSGWLTGYVIIWATHALAAWHLLAAIERKRG